MVWYFFVLDCYCFTAGQIRLGGDVSVKETGVYIIFNEVGGLNI